jgi:hypothetical protein
VPLSDRLRGQPPFFWLALVVASAVLALYPFSVGVLLSAGGRGADFGWTAERDAAGRLAISEICAGGPAEGRLAVGDRLRTVNRLPPVARSIDCRAHILLPGSIR